MWLSSNQTKRLHVRRKKVVTLFLLVILQAAGNPLVTVSAMETPPAATDSATPSPEPPLTPVQILPQDSATPSALPSPTEPAATSSASPSPSSEAASASPSATPSQPSPDLPAPSTPSATSTPLPSLAPPPASAPSATAKLPLVVYELAKEVFQANQVVEINLENARFADIKVSLLGPDDEEAVVRIAEEPVGETGLRVSLIPPAGLVPGRYKLTITDRDSGKTVERGFIWGTLAINTDKNIYSPNETVKLFFTVFDGSEARGCDDELRLAVFSEKAGTAEDLSTAQGTIRCQGRGAGDTADYEATYKVGEEGNYHLTLTARTEKGTTAVTGSFSVKNSVPFEVRREAPTRIYPPGSYAIRNFIRANEDFEGTVEETVPAGFSLSPSPDNPYIATETATFSIRPNAIPSLAIPFSGQPQISLHFGEVYSDANLVENILNKFGLSGHDGVDFTMPAGTSVTAADDGEVIKAGEGPYGTTIILRHSWGKSYYGHLSSVAVVEGQSVKRGGRVGLSGDSGESTGPHLHFALEPAVGAAPAGFNGRVDPLPFLGLNNNSQGVATTSQTIIRWQVNLKKGQEIVLPYSLTAPNVSPEFYLLGPLRFFRLDKSPVFSESRSWQIAAEAIPGSTFIDLVKKEGLRKIRTVELSELSNPSEDFTSEELPEFSFGLAPAKFTKLLRSPKKLDSVIRKLKHAERNDIDDFPTEATIEVSTKRLLIAPKILNDFKPGRYRLTVQVPSAEGLVNLEQDFTWGVLALNTNRSVYRPEETVKLGMAILDDYGRTKCLNSRDVFDRGRLWLTITFPSGKREELSTDNGKIYDSGKCDVHSVTNEADFQAIYKVVEVGTYQMHLEGENQNGRRSIDDIFKVDTALPFEIERASLPTRIYPAADYTNTLTVVANQDFAGEIREEIPDGFQISQITPTSTVPGAGTSADGTKYISWSVSLKKGETVTLSYTFHAPNVSPEFYLLGPLKFFQLDKFGKLGQSPVFFEPRSWQIAADATKTWDGGCTGKSNTLWSCANNWNNNTLPASTDDLVFDATSGDPNDWDTLAGSTYNSVTYNSTYTGVSTFTCPGAFPSCDLTGGLTWTSGTGGTLAFVADVALLVGGNITMTSTQTFTPNTSSVSMTGTANLNSDKTFYGLVINGVNTTVSVVTNSPTVSGTLTIGGSLDGNNDTLSIGTGLTVTSGTAGAVTIYGSGVDTISGAGTLVVQNSSLSTNGTLSSIVRFDATSGDVNMPARTYGGDVEFYSSSTASARNVVMLSTATQSISGNLLGRAEGTFSAILTGTTNNPTVNVTGNVSFTGAGSGSEAIMTGTGTWTVSGNVNFTGGTISTTTNNLFKMNGSSKTLTSASQSFYNFEVSGGSISPQDAMVVANDLTVSAGTLAMGTNSLTVGLTSWTNSGSIKVASGATVSQSASGTTTVKSSAAGANCIGANSTNCATGTAGTIGFYNLTIGDSSTTFTTTINGGVAPTVTVGNALNITANATLSANGTLNVAGNWTKTGGFTANSSAVNLNGAGGSTQTLAGSTTFYDLSATTASARTLTFTASTTQTISHSLTFTGAASNLLTLQSSSSPTVWNINTTGATTSLSYLTVSDSSSTACINASNSSGTNTTNWDFTGGSCGSGPTNDQLLRHGEWFNTSGARQPFTF